MKIFDPSILLPCECGAVRRLGWSKWCVPTDNPHFVEGQQAVVCDSCGARSKFCDTKEEATIAANAHTWRDCELDGYPEGHDGEYWVAYRIDGAWFTACCWWAGSGFYDAGDNILATHWRPIIPPRPAPPETKLTKEN